MEGNVFFSIAPPALQPPQWTADIDALVSVIDNATQYVLFLPFEHCFFLLVFHVSFDNRLISRLSIRFFEHPCFFILFFRIQTSFSIQIRICQRHGFLS